MKPESKKFIATVGGRPLTFETGKLAAQAGGAVTVQFGETVVFAAATMGNEPREGQDFFPLTVHYQEKFSAAGRIPTGDLYEALALQRSLTDIANARRDLSSAVLIRHKGDKAPLAAWQQA